MFEHELAAVENALVSVASARKYVQFYPANNSSVQNSLDQLVSALNALIECLIKYCPPKKGACELTQCQLDTPQINLNSSNCY